jgi:hypothetical protein
MIERAEITGFEWDSGNERKNDKHGVGQFEAEEVFFNQPLLVLEDTKHSDAEPRFHALGVTHADRPLHITFTLRQGGTRIRIISARDMHRKERAIHDEAKQIDGESAVGPQIPE